MVFMILNGKRPPEFLCYTEATGREHVIIIIQKKNQKKTFRSKVLL